jgi:hypothetical protein
MRLAWIFGLSPALRARLIRVGFNLHPAFRGTGGRMTHVSHDLRLMQARLNHGWRTKNIVGSIYGGSLFAVTDGPHPMMLMAALGRDVIVWDKTAVIRYRKPAFTDLTVDFRLTDLDLEKITTALKERQECEHDFSMELLDNEGQTHASIVRTIYIATRQHYQSKIQRSA